VALFFVLSGFVNSLKPLKLARQNKVDAALSNLALSSFRRTFRFMLPAAAATVVSWFLCNLGLYELARHGDAFWLYENTPSPSSSWGVAIEDLARGLRITWSLTYQNPYDQPQWVLKWLLLGSFFIFMTLLITINMTPMWRAVAVIIFSWCSFDWTFYIHDRK
jgi:hypothetical protein